MLTAAQRKQRAGKITASRVGCLMRGTAQDIMDYYLELIGEKEEADLSQVWEIQLGVTTEQLNLDWAQYNSEILKELPLSDIPADGHVHIIRRGEIVINRLYPFAAATIDGWIDELNYPIEAKHTGGHEPFEVVLARYQPQLHFQMVLCNAEHCALSVIMGARKPVVQIVQHDHNYSDELMHRAEQFAHYVRRREPPVILPPAPPPIDAMRDVDMSQDDTWRRHAQQWIQTRGAAEVAEKCEKILKELMPADARKAWGCGVRITRDRRSRLSLRADT